MKDLTDRQKEVYGFIKDYIKSHQYPPTLREVADHFSISVKGSFDHLRALKKKNFIKRNIGQSRSLELVRDCDCEPEESQVNLVPLIGSVAAGKPVFAEENFDGMVEVPAGIVRNGKHFALRVKGDSMKNAGILDGDTAIILHQEEASNGDIIVALIDDSATLKRIFIEKNRFKLQAENEAFGPIYVTDLKVLGKLVFILRKYD